MKKFLDSTMTWRSYLKVGGILSLITLIGEGIWFALNFGDEIKSWLGEKIYAILPKKDE